MPVPPAVKLTGRSTAVPAGPEVVPTDVTGVCAIVSLAKSRGRARTLRRAKMTFNPSLSSKSCISNQGSERAYKLGRISYSWIVAYLKSSALNRCLTRLLVGFLAVQSTGRLMTRVGRILVRRCSELKTLNEISVLKPATPRRRTILYLCWGLENLHRQLQNYYSACQLWHSPIS